MRPPRIEWLFTRYEQPIYFITCCTQGRKPWLATEAVHEALRQFAERALSLNRAAVGAYVLMPDHLHLFVRLQPDQPIGAWVKALKAVLRRHGGAAGSDSRWQPGFFDHVIRHGESYAQKWAYVFENPVRAGLVKAPTDWPFHGEIVPLYQ